MTIDHQPQADSVTASIVRALLEQADAYRGLAHAEAVVALDERGEPERAWRALQSAAWWAGRKLGQVPVSMIDGVRFLASRRNWVNAQWVVERALRHAESV